MKKFSFMAMAALGLLFAACSSDKDVVDEGQKDINLAKQGVGYIKVGLNLPSTPSTRAWGESTDLDDGAESEYAVDNALILIFSGSSEATAKLVQVSSLLNTSWNNPVSASGKANEVTTNHVETVPLTTTTGNLYALVVVNSTGIIESGTADNKVKILNGATLEEITFSGTGSTDIFVSTLQGKIANAVSGASKFLNDTKIFMTNAVLSNVHGGSFNPGAYPGSVSTVKDYHILAPINKSYIYETKAEADATTAKVAADIYVERAVAKVTLQVADAITINGPAVVTGTLTAAFDGWTLANTNNTSYIVRQVPDYKENVFEWNFTSASLSSGERYRFVGLNAVDVEYGTELAGYRTYWAKDTKYDEDVTSGDLFTPDLTAATGTYKEAKDASSNLVPQYCNENTFDVARQAYKNTTTAVLKVTYKVGGSAVELYTVGVDRKTFYTEADVKTLVANALMANADFKDWLNDNKKDASVVKITATDITNITFTTRDESTGVVKVDDATISEDVLKSSITTDQSVKTNISGGTTILSSINTAIGEIKNYKGGVSYYAIRIKHFGDDLTPWKDTEVNGKKPAESTIDDIYPLSVTGSDAQKKAANNAYLGRYGVVRNNWYDITVDDIAKIGAPTPGELKLNGDHPDDELDDAYIKARINILSWAKRTQSWSLK